MTAGTVNCDGQVTVRAEHSGQQTVIADIVRMVEMAQVRNDIISTWGSLSLVRDLHVLYLNVSYHFSARCHSRYHF